MNSPSTGVMVWWVALGATSIMNLAVWFIVAKQLARQKPSMDPDDYAFRRQQLLLSTIFVFGCAFRSFVPLAEGRRVCVYDSWISNAIITRSVATVAELCLVTQWTLILRQCARSVGALRAVALSYLPIPLIACAEISSWYSALTTNAIGSVVEESIWALTGGLIVSNFVSLLPRLGGTKRLFVAVSTAFIGSYVIFMCLVDVPMYWSRWRAAQERGTRYLTMSHGFSDAATRRIVTRRWEDWREEIPWMSLYFSMGVWGSLALVRAPRFADARGQPMNDDINRTPLTNMPPSPTLNTTEP